jgi:hypothetical protein
LLSFLLESIDDPQNCVVDVDGLARKLADSILAREYLETRHNTVEDEGLVGLLNLMSNVMKHNPPFQTSREGQEFLAQVCFLLFCIIIRNYLNLKTPLNLLQFPNLKVKFKFTIFIVQILTVLVSLISNSLYFYCSVGC